MLECSNRAGCTASDSCEAVADRLAEAFAELIHLKIRSSEKTGFEGLGCGTVLNQPAGPFKGKPFQKRQHIRQHNEPWCRLPSNPLGAFRTTRNHAVGLFAGLPNVQVDFA